MSKTELSVIFITKNEEFHIGNAIDNVKDFAEAVFVVDSGSTDRTVEIAKAKGAQVLFHPFEGFGAQWNWALDNCPVKSAWTMKMDPDERLTDELKKEIVEELHSNKFDVFNLGWIPYFMGRRLKVRSIYVTRIWRTGQAHFGNNSVNEHLHADGRVHNLRNRMLHYDSKDLDTWVAKQNMYSTREAEMRFSHGEMAASPKFFGSTIERRMWLKKYFYCVPCRSLLEFLYCYIVLGAWKSGAAGFYWAQMRVFVSRLVALKWKEMQWRAKGDERLRKGD